VEQREGRILRQGNDCEDVEIFRYVTEGSFDSYMWQALETKARFIAQVMSGDKGLRSIEDVELAALSYAEVKALASGNPLVIEKAGVDAEVAKLSTLFSVWRNQRYANESEVARLPMLIESLERKLVLLEQDAECAEPVSVNDMRVELAGRSLVGPEAVGEGLRQLVRAAKAAQCSVEQRVGRFAGLGLGLRASRDDGIPGLYLQGHCRYEADVYQTAQGLVAALLAALASVPKERDAARQQLAVRGKRLADLRIELERPFEHEGRLADLLTRQRRLQRQLDLDKDATGASRMDTEDTKLAA
jgi:hypothetical protein